MQKECRVIWLKVRCLGASMINFLHALTVSVQYLKAITIIVGDHEPRLAPFVRFMARKQQVSLGTHLFKLLKSQNERLN